MFIMNVDGSMEKVPTTPQPDQFDLGSQLHGTFFQWKSMGRNHDVSFSATNCDIIINKSYQIAQQHRANVGPTSAETLVQHWQSFVQWADIGTMLANHHHTSTGSMKVQHQ